MSSDEYILEISSTEGLTNADYLKAVVVKCLQSLHEGEESCDGDKNSEPYSIEVISPERVIEPERVESVVDYIDFDEYMVNEVVICESDGPDEDCKNGDRSSAVNVEFDRKKESEVVNSFRSDHLYHHIYQPDRDHGSLSPLSYVTIMEDGNIEVVETEIKTKRGRKKGSKNKLPKIPKAKVRKKRIKPDLDMDEEDINDTDDVKKSRKKSNAVKRRAVPKIPKEPKPPKEPKRPKVPKPPKEPKPPKPPKPPKEPKPPKPPKEPRIKKERVRPLSTREKPNNEVVIRRSDVDIAMDSTTNDITDPDVQAAIRTLKEGNKENDSTLAPKAGYSIYDPEGKVIMPFIPKKYNETLPFWCDECEFKTRTRQRLKLHKLRKHGGVKQYQCRECAYSAHDAYSVRIHYGNMHQEVKKFTCDQCSFACNYKAGLRKHINRIHGNKKPYQCSQCGYQQFNITILKQHIQSVHMGIMPFGCSFCDKRFIDERRLNLHVRRLHYRVKRYRCAKCSFSAFTKCEVKKHLFSHHMKLANVECPQCSYKTRTRQELSQHIRRVHTLKQTKQDPTGNSCQFCDFRTHFSKDLVSHVHNFHGISKSFRCDACDFLSFDVSALKKHIKENHNPNTLKCKSCNFTTMNTKTMKDHKKTHVENVAFPCSMCNAKFRYKMCLTKHEFAKHGRNLSEEPEDDNNTVYEKKWISYDQSNNDTTWEVIGDGDSHTVTYVGVNTLANIELDRLIADTVAGEQDVGEERSVIVERGYQSYLCTTCNIIFEDKSLMNWHINKHDLEESFCELASNKSNFIPEPNEEMVQIMERKFATCNECGFVEDRGNLLIQHILVTHYDCSIPGIDYRQNISDADSDNVTSHQDKLGKRLFDPVFCCTSCDFTSTSKVAYLSHKQVCSKEADYVVPCEIVISEDVRTVCQAETLEPVEVMKVEDQSNDESHSPSKPRKKRKRSTSSVPRVVPEVKHLPRRRTNREYTSTDEEGEVAKERKNFNCTKCIFSCDKKRVMAQHYLNAHICEPKQPLSILDLKISLCEKLGVRFPTPIFNIEVEDSEFVDDPADPVDPAVIGSLRSADLPPLKKIKLSKLKTSTTPSTSPEKDSADQSPIDSADINSAPLFDDALSSEDQDPSSTSMSSIKIEFNEKLARAKKDLLQQLNLKCISPPDTPTKESTNSSEADQKNQAASKSEAAASKSIVASNDSGKKNQVKPGSTAASKSTKASNDSDKKNQIESMNIPSTSKSTVASNVENKIRTSSRKTSPSKYLEIIKSLSKRSRAKPDPAKVKPKSISKEPIDVPKPVTKSSPPKKKVQERKKQDVQDELICSKCDAKMASLETLNMHTILAHGFSILLTCSYCCYTTSIKSDLRRHICRCFLINS